MSQHTESITHNRTCRIHSAHNRRHHADIMASRTLKRRRHARHNPPRLKSPKDCRISTVHCRFSTVHCRISTHYCRFSTVGCRISYIYGTKSDSDASISDSEPFKSDSQVSKSDSQTVKQSGRHENSPTSPTVTETETADLNWKPSWNLDWKPHRKTAR